MLDAAVRQELQDQVHPEARNCGKLSVAKQNCLMRLAYSIERHQNQNKAWALSHQ